MLNILDPVNDFLIQMQQNQNSQRMIDSNSNLTGEISNFNDKFASIKNTLDSIGNSLEIIAKGIGKVFYYMMNPLVLIKDIWYAVVTYSYPVCIMICLGGIIIYLIGYKKAGKWATGSLMAYIAIQMLNVAFK